MLFCVWVLHGWTKVVVHFESRRIGHVYCIRAVVMHHDRLIELRHLTLAIKNRRCGMFTMTYSIAPALLAACKNQLSGIESECVADSQQENLLSHFERFWLSSPHPQLQNIHLNICHYFWGGSCSLLSSRSLASCQWRATNAISQQICLCFGQKGDLSA